MYVLGPQGSTRGPDLELNAMYCGCVPVCVTWAQKQRRIHLFSGTAPANGSDVKCVIALRKGKAGKVIVFEDSFWVVNLFPNYKSRISLWLESLKRIYINNIN